MSIEFDIACLRAPCDPNDLIGVTQLIDRAKMAADQIEELIKQRDEATKILRMFESWWRLQNSQRTIEAIEPAMRSTIEILYSEDMNP